MPVLPQLPPASNDETISIVIPAALVPYMDLIHSLAAPEKTKVQWLTDYVIDKGKEYLAAHTQQQLKSQSEAQLVSDLQTMAQEIQQLTGE